MHCLPRGLLPTISRDRLSTNETHEKENFYDWYIIKAFALTVSLELKSIAIQDSKELRGKTRSDNLNTETFAWFVGATSITSLDWRQYLSR